ncbi:MAG: DUF2085 domain-containing protein [Anaerolineaceae bacterium]
MKRFLSRPGVVLLIAPFILILTGLLIGGWIYFTPAGLMGKADAIGYAVCHRISHRSFFLDDRQLPLCARCTGMYLGAFITLLFQLPRRKSGGMPSKKWLVFLGFLVMLFGVDGLNSYLHLIPNAPSAYESQNWLRLATGTGMGVGLSAVLFPIFNQSAWSNWSGERALSGSRQFILLVLTLVLANLAVLTGSPILLYPLSIISAFTILVILTMVYTIVWMMVVKRENTYLNLSALRLPLVAGLATAMAQIILMDGLRFLWSGSWLGFQL